MLENLGKKFFLIVNRIFFLDWKKKNFERKQIIRKNVNIGRKKMEKKFSLFGIEEC